MMNTYDYEEMLQIKIAWYYYMEGLTQQEIGRKLSIPRLRVNRLLDKARKNGMIQFQIRAGHSSRMQLEQRLMQLFQLKDVFIAPSPMGETPVNENVALAAATYIHDHLQQQCFLNMGYGDTSSRLLNHVATMSDFPVNVVSLTGGVSNYLPNVQSNIFNVKLHLTPAPLLMKTKELVRAIMEEPGVQQIRSMTQAAAMSIVGIGGLNENATVLRNGLLSYNDYLLLTMKGAVGDILCHFFDINGRLISSDIEDRLISTPLDDLQKMDNTIGVAAGPEKAKAILAALRGNYLNVLITDEATAQSVLNLEEAASAK